MTKHLFYTLMIAIAATVAMASCRSNNARSTSDGGGESKSQTSKPNTQIPEFSADSAYAFCQQQCDFGPRTMNSEAHEKCGQWIAQKFASYGLTVIEQRATLKGFDGTPLLSNNIIASYRPELSDRILICAHWDSRPWADNDPDEANWTKPVMAANDGASGVAVMLELARLLGGECEEVSGERLPQEQDNPPTPHPSPLTSIGVDFICCEAEDWGTDGDSDSWALGAQYWAAHPHREGYTAHYGILLDMVGGQGARFFREGYSQYYAPKIVEKVWRAAEAQGYGSLFPGKDGGTITDDHVPVNQVAGIPCIDIIPYYPDCQESSFGPTWHTVNDDMAHIDPNILKAVGQTLVQVLLEK